MSDTSLMELLLDRVVSHLVDKLQVQVGDEYTRVGLVRGGKLQDDPLVNKLNILVHPGGVDEPDVLLPKEHEAAKAVRTAHYFGGLFWLRKLRLELELFYTGADRDEARRRTNVIVSRAVYHLNRLPLNGLTDTFGETAHICHPYKIIVREGGGPPSNFIWRGEIFLQFVTDMITDNA